MSSAQSLAVRLRKFSVILHRLIITLAVVFIYLVFPDNAQAPAPLVAGAPASADNWTHFQQTGFQFDNLKDWFSNCGILGGAPQGCQVRDPKSQQLFVYKNIPGGGALGGITK